MTVEAIEWFLECGCNVDEIAEYFCVPKSAMRRIIWNLLA